MRYYLFIFTAFLYGLTSCAQADRPVVNLIAPTTEAFPFTLGNKVIELRKSVYEIEDGFVFIQLHHNETTAERAAVDYLQQNGGVLYSLLNKGERNISFKLKGKWYTFDPNRMFTRQGITASLKLYGHYSSEAADEIGQLATFVLSHLPTGRPVVAMHNNTDNRYSVHSYLYTNEYARQVAEVAANKNEDADNFFITTDSNVHRYLKSLNFNSVLQNNKSGKNDGSLSYYYGLRHQPYVNIEAEEGKLNRQIEMVEALAKILK